MDHIIVAVHDRQLKAFLRPFVANTIGQAVRSFSDEVNRAGSDLNAHPEDYTLWQLGTFNDHDGNISTEGREQIAIASNLLVQSK